MHEVSLEKGISLFISVQVYPDTATHREMSRLEVHCSNRDSGCQETFSYMQLQV